MAAMLSLPTLEAFWALPDEAQAHWLAYDYYRMTQLDNIISGLQSHKDEKGRMTNWTPEAAAILLSAKV